MSVGQSDPPVPAAPAAPRSVPVTPPPAARGPRLLRPLRHRDFRLLYLGLTVSLIGDGVYIVAIAWQVYEISNSPASLALVGVAWTLPQALLMLLGGIVADRWDRRRVLIAADVVRGAAVALLGAGALAGVLRVWEIAALVALLGAGDALFLPAMTAIVPSLVAGEELVQANAIDRFVQPLAVRFAGPALGGGLIALLGAGEAFLVDAGTFAFSAVAVARMRPVARAADAARAGLAKELREGVAFVRANAWLWVTLATAAVALLAFFGPVQVLVPYLVRHRLHAGAGAFGAVLAAGGVGGIVASVVLGQRGLPRRHVTFMYAAWAISCAALAAYAVAQTQALFMLAAAVAGAGTAAGMVVWGTLMQRLVPDRLLGRVSSVDWTVSTALLPVSFALTAPLADLAGATTTLAVAGLGSAAVTMACLFVRGVRDPERAAPAGDPAGAETATTVGD